MIKYAQGNIVKSETEAIVNTVNTQGVMGKGIALAFKNAFPVNFKLYEKACRDKLVNIGKLYVTETGVMFPKYIINFPTKKHWRENSRYEYIEVGLKDLLRIIKEKNIRSISVPPLGAGNGRLDWQKVKEMIIREVNVISNEIDIIIFEPGFNDQSLPQRKQVELTNARALFIYLLKNYQVMGEEINLLVAQKIAYFLQRFGEDLRLNFEKGWYGPYADNLNHLLKHINHCYIEYDQESNSPANVIQIVQEKYKDVELYFETKLSGEQKERAAKVLKLIEGFESPYGLEILATIDFISLSTGINEAAEIEKVIGEWSRRKREIMKPGHIVKAWERVKGLK